MQQDRITPATYAEGFCPVCVDGVAGYCDERCETREPNGQPGNFPPVDVDRGCIERHGITLRRVWFSRDTYSAQLGFCTDDGVSELRRLFVADGATVPTVDGLVVAFVTVER